MADITHAQAEQAANDYIRTVPHSSTEQRLLAFEDYVAGFLAKPDKLQTDLEFAIAQLQQLVDLAQRESEFYSLSIARYTLQVLGHLKP